MWCEIGFGERAIRPYQTTRGSYSSTNLWMHGGWSRTRGVLNWVSHSAAAGWIKRHDLIRDKACRSSRRRPPGWLPPPRSRTATSCLDGGGDDDLYIIVDPLIRRGEQINAGIDAVRSSITWTLGANFKNQTFIGKNSITGTGSGTANRINGNAGRTRWRAAGFLIGGRDRQPERQDHGEWRSLRL